jgi:DNA-binding NtrC family response regulator
MMASVLIVDDDALLRRALSDRLKHWGYAVEEAEDGRAALQAVARREFDLILLDLSMPGISGLEVLRQARETGCNADIVILTAHGSIESAVEAVKLGADEFLQKPADFDLLRAILARSLERRRLEKVNLALSDQLGGAGALVTGDSPLMKELLDTAARAAPSNATLLLTGESGSGKQVLAEYIHRASARAGGPFVYVNCAALSDELIESTLFGHEKGAFTGAVARKEGRLEAAAGGTAFLDEIGDVTPRLQTKLLHFLETNEFERVGGTRTITVDCRMIAATNRDLEAAVKEGQFREDLYFRLNVIRLRIPPLRERPEDIAVLAQAFLERFAAELRRTELKFAPRTIEILQAYAWPGNVRQLKNAVERMAVLARNYLLTPDLLPPEMMGTPEDPAMPSGLPLKDALRHFRKEYIRRALARAGGNQTKAAEDLGLQRTFLNRLIKEYEI